MHQTILWKFREICSFRQATKDVDAIHCIIQLLDNLEAPERPFYSSKKKLYQAIRNLDSKGLQQYKDSRSYIVQSLSCCKNRPFSKITLNLSEDYENFQYCSVLLRQLTKQKQTTRDMLTPLKDSTLLSAARKVKVLFKDTADTKNIVILRVLQPLIRQRI